MYISHLIIPVISISLPCYLSCLGYVNLKCVITKLSDEVYYIRNGFFAYFIVTCNASFTHNVSNTYIYLYIYIWYHKFLSVLIPVGLCCHLWRFHKDPFHIPHFFLIKLTIYLDQSLFQSKHYRPNVNYVLLGNISCCTIYQMRFILGDLRFETVISWAIQEVATVSTIRLSAPLSVSLVSFDGPL